MDPRFPRGRVREKEDKNPPLSAQTEAVEALHVRVKNGAGVVQVWLPP